MATATKPVRRKYSGRNPITTAEPHPFMIRMSEDMLAYLRARAEKNFRSLNLEILSMLHRVREEDEAQAEARRPLLRARSS